MPNLINRNVLKGNSVSIKTYTMWQMFALSRNVAQGQHQKAMFIPKIKNVLFFKWVYVKMALKFRF
jgi:hypothetical protein